MKQIQKVDLNWGIEDVYRLLMQNIESELLPENYEILSEKYVDEIFTDRKKRYAHYADCLEIFLERLEILMGALQKHVTGAYCNLKKQIEQISNKNEEEFFDTFEDFLKST